MLYYKPGYQKLPKRNSVIVLMAFNSCCAPKNCSTTNSKKKKFQDTTAEALCGVYLEWPSRFTDFASLHLTSLGQLDWFPSSFSLSDARARPRFSTRTWGAASGKRRPLEDDRQWIEMPRNIPMIEQM